MKPQQQRRGRNLEQTTGPKRIPTVGQPQADHLREAGIPTTKRSDLRPLKAGVPNQTFQGEVRVTTHVVGCVMPGFDEFEIHAGYLPLPLAGAFVPKKGRDYI